MSDCEAPFYKRPLPGDLRAVAEREFVPETALMLAIPGDMLLSGEFGETWLLMSSDRIAALARVEGRQPVVVAEFDLNSVSDIRLDRGISSALLEIVHAGHQHRLLRLSNARLRDFTEIVRLIKAWVDKKEWHPEEAQDRRHVCPVCRRPLPENMTICPHCLDKHQMLRRVLRYLLPYRLRVSLLMLCMSASTIVGLVNPYLGKIIVDQVIGPLENRHWLLWIVLAMVLFHVLSTIIEIATRRIAARVGTETIYDIRGDMFRKLQELSLSFYSRHRAGALTTKVNQDTNQLQRLLVDFIPYGTSSLLTAVGILALLLYLSWSLTLFVLVPIASIVCFMWFIFPRFRIYWERYFEKRSRLAAFVTDVITGVRVVKAFAQERSEVERFGRRSQALRDATFQAELRWAQAMPLLHMIATLGTPIVWLVGGMLAFKGRMTLGDIIAYSGYLMMLFRPIFVLTRMAEMIPNSLAAASRVFDIIDTEPEIADRSDSRPVPSLRGKIEFRNVTFGYDSRKPALEDISMTIQPGELIGLVGHSGAGKSTAINLVCRFFDVDAGAILIDDIDIRNIRYEDLRRQIGIVLQETFLFNGTICENIAYARPDADLLAVVQAAKAANAHEFIMEKPDGYDTQITEGGNNLSVGEKQRIAIARAILCDPKILILDEATASVDLETEKKIQDALARLVKGRTTIAIAHRLSTLKNAHRLAVLEHGKLTEIGSHEELLSLDGIYAHLVKLQTDLSQVRGVGG